MRATVPCTAMLILLPLLAGCVTQPHADIMATFYPLEFFAQQIAGADLKVLSVVKPGTEPHDYEPTPQDLSLIVHAKALVIQGAGFEAWLRIAQTQAPGTALITATDGIPMQGNSDAAEAANLPQDPHTWLDPVLAQQMARTIEKGLVSVYPERSAQMQANAEQLVARLEVLDDEYRSGLTNCSVPFAITNHAAWGYLAQRYDFTQIAISGLDPNAEPDPTAIQQVVDAARAHHVKVIFFEELASPKIAQAIAREAGAVTRQLSPIESLAPAQKTEGKDYFSVMRGNLVNLREGMECP